MNSILAGLELQEEFWRLRLELVRVTANTILAEESFFSMHCLFPLTAVISRGATLENGRTVGVGLVGSEGLLSISRLLGVKSAAHVATVQVPGYCLRARTEVLRAILKNNSMMQERLLKYLAVTYLQVCQSVVCNRAHLLEQRLCRWLLEFQDRSGASELAITHEALSQLLGSARADTSRAAGKLRDLGFLQLSHGKLTITDRKGLESICCECYGIVKNSVVHSTEQAANMGKLA